MKATGLRQQSGFACQECRRRKARCDRARPQCGLCMETGIACVITEKRLQRGPKKDQLDLPRSQTGKQSENHERNVVSPNSNPTRPGPAISGEMMSELEHNLYLNIDEISDSYLTQIAGWAESGSTGKVADLTMDSSVTIPDAISITTPPPIPGSPKLSALILADLDQLYFDRVHPVCPMIDRRRYFAWADQESLSLARTCLQSTMRTLAAALSAQYRDFSDELYAETRRLLETCSQTQTIEAPWLMSNDRVLLEQIQAWLLLAHYESLRMDEHQAMLTAGHAFRLVQIARLHDIDAPDDISLLTTEFESEFESESESDKNFAEAEERRRTFWLAFSLDRFLCSRNECPLTLQEEMVCTRLPASETNLQNSQRIRVGFLSQSMAQNGPSTLSPFAKCIMMATLHGRCMAHRWASTKESGKDTRSFWVRHDSLASAAEKCVMLLEQCQTSPAVEHEPMLLFAHMLAHSAVLHLNCTVQRTLGQTVEHQLMTNAYEQRASRAASEMVRLAKALPSFSCFQAHPFLPNPLAAATTFLINHPNLKEGGEESVKYLLRLLKNLSGINNLALKPLSGEIPLIDYGGEYVL